MKTFNIKFYLKLSKYLLVYTVNLVKPQLALYKLFLLLTLFAAILNHSQTVPQKLCVQLSVHCIRAAGRCLYY